MSPFPTILHSVQLYSPTPGYSPLSSTIFADPRPSSTVPYWPCTFPVVPHYPQPCTEMSHPVRPTVLPLDRFRWTTASRLVLSEALGIRLAGLCWALLGPQTPANTDAVRILDGCESDFGLRIGKVKHGVGKGKGTSKIYAKLTLYP